VLVVLVAQAACSGAPAPAGPAPTPIASASPEEQQHREVDERARLAAPWHERQRDRQSAFLGFRACVEVCKGDSACEARCGSPPTHRARCASCRINGRCQILTDEEASSLDCCLPLSDDRGCFPPKAP